MENIAFQNERIADAICNTNQVLSNLTVTLVEIAIAANILDVFDSFWHESGDPLCDLARFGVESDDFFDRKISRREKEREEAIERYKRCCEDEEKRKNGTDWYSRLSSIGSLREKDGGNNA